MPENSIWCGKPKQFNKFEILERFEYHPRTFELYCFVDYIERKQDYEFARIVFLDLYTEWIKSALSRLTRNDYTNAQVRSIVSSCVTGH